MRRLRWIFIFCAPAGLLLLVRLGIGHVGGSRPGASAVDDSAPTASATTSDRGRRAQRIPIVGDLPSGGEASIEVSAPDEPRPDPWALPESDPRRGLVEAFRGMNEDTSPAEAERQYLTALERGGFASESWTGAARTAAGAWFAGLDAAITCYAGGCAALLQVADAAALDAARQKVAQQATAAAWTGPVITAPAVAEADGRHHQLWIFVRPE